jgi:hypothetical protein
MFLYKASPGDPETQFESLRFLAPTMKIREVSVLFSNFLFDKRKGKIYDPITDNTGSRGLTYSDRMKGEGTSANS